MRAEEVSARSRKRPGLPLCPYHLLGDFSDYRRAKVRTHLPFWLTREEIQRLFACLDERTRLMAQTMYGSGLRLMELLRLRVKDLDLEQEVLTKRGVGISVNFGKGMARECGLPAFATPPTFSTDLSLVLSASASAGN